MISVSRTLLLAVVVAIAGAFAGCGGGDDASDASDTTVRSKSGLPIEAAAGLPLRPNFLTKVQYTARANAICRESWADMLEELDRERRSRSGVSEEDLFASISQNSFVLHMQFWFDDISYLGTPKGEKSELEAMLEALQLAVCNYRPHTDPLQPVQS